ncbi:MAG: fucose isomerase [bacterium]|nr:fucose isomerase [bacterium]
MERTRIGLISFTDPRSVDLASEAVGHETASQRRLAEALSAAGMNVVQPFDGPVNSLGQVNAAVQAMKSADIDCLVLGCWKWTDPMLAVEAVRRLDVPVMLYTDPEESFTGLGCLSAIGASIWEIAPHTNARNHTRCYGDTERLIRWARGVGAYRRLRNSAILLWGGSYCLRMEHLQDDPSRLKSFLIRDILIEDQYMLIRRAEDIMKNNAHEVDRFIGWLRDNGVDIRCDGGRLDDRVLTTQAAFYLAARQRLSELADEGIAGISIKCQPELSDEYGVTACFLPAFLPFPADHAGPQPIVTAACEGDIKGLITSVLMNFIRPDVPATFGDIRDIVIDGRHHLVIANCGGASVYYARNSSVPAETLPGVRIAPQCQGKAGGAVGYLGRATEMTVARLGRIAGEYVMYLGAGRAVDVQPEMLERMKWGASWPHVIIDLNLDMDRFVDEVVSNHYSFIEGNIVAEMEYACAAAGIKVRRMGSS